MEIARDDVARRGTESDSTRAHRLTIVREVGGFLRLDGTRTDVHLAESRSARVVQLSFQVVDAMAEPFDFSLELVTLMFATRRARVQPPCACASRSIRDLRRPGSPTPARAS